MHAARARTPALWRDLSSIASVAFRSPAANSRGSGARSAFNLQINNGARVIPATALHRRALVSGPVEATLGSVPIKITPTIHYPISSR